MKTITTCVAAGAALLLAACGQVPKATALGSDPAGFCQGLIGRTIPAASIGLPSGDAKIETARLVTPNALSTLERGPTPAAVIVPAKPQRCEVVGSIAPIDRSAPAIRFQVNLPTAWNGRSVQYGGGGFNGVLITGEALVPAARYDQPSPLGQGYVTYGTDSGHQNQQGQPPQVFALNDEALVNFAHASYKKVRDVAVAVMKLAYGQGPSKLYFVGSSEGGREGLVMAQRYPKDFDGIFSRVPVLNWTGLQHAGLRDGLALAGDGWIPPDRVAAVHNAVLAACDGADGLTDSIVSDPVGCRKRFNIEQMRCGAAASTTCLSDAQIRAVKTLHSDLDLGTELAHGVRRYPGRGPSGENTPSFGPTGGWQSWWTGTQAPAFPPVQANGIAWFYGGGAIQYFYARNPNADLRSYRMQDHLPRVREVSALMDATNPDLSAFHAAGGKLILLENLADYAQSPYAGIEYFQAVQQKLGADTVRRFARLYTAPGVDHVGSGAPGNADLFPALVAWVEQGREPAGLTLVEQENKAPFAVTRARPLCEWPTWPRYRGGDPNAAASFECSR